MPDITQIIAATPSGSILSRGTELDYLKPISFGYGTGSITRSYSPRTNSDVTLSGVISSSVDTNLSFYDSSALIGSRQKLNFIDGDSITFTVADNPGSGWVDISAVATGSGLGDMVGPSAGTDNAIVRFNGTTGKLTQDSRGIIDDNGILTASGVVITNGSVSGIMLYGSGLFVNGHPAGLGPSIYILTPTTDNTASTQIKLQSQSNPVGDTFTVSKMGTIGGTQLSLQSSSLTGVNKILQTASTSTYLTTSTGVLSWSNDASNVSAGQTDLILSRHSSGILLVSNQSNNPASVICQSIWVSGLLNSYDGQRVKRVGVADINYSVLSSDYIVGYRTLTASRTVTLPSSVNASGQIYVIKDEAGAAASFNIVVSGQAGQLIDGANTALISSNYASLSLYSDNSKWFIF